MFCVIYQSYCRTRTVSLLRELILSVSVYIYEFNFVLIKFCFIQPKHRIKESKKEKRGENFLIHTFKQILRSFVWSQPLSNNKLISLIEKICSSESL